MSKPFYYGGQAVVEGVMMRGQRYATVACRRPDGEIVTRTEELNPTLREQTKAIPILRGVLLLWETMQLGVRSLFFSNQVAEGRDPQAPLAKATIIGAILASVSFSALLFFLGPLLVTAWLEPRVGQHATVMFEGLIRLFALLGYVWSIGFVPGVRRLFEHHGAEHKTVNAYEAGAPLTPESVRRYSLIHTRCGTSFLLTVMVVSIVVFSVIGRQPLWMEVITRVALIPLIAGAAYEILRFTADHYDNRIVRVLTRPNLELQYFTTREPTDEQLELAILSLTTVLALDGVPLPRVSGVAMPAVAMVTAGFE